MFGTYIFTNKQFDYFSRNREIVTLESIMEKQRKANEANFRDYKNRVMVKY